MSVSRRTFIKVGAAAGAGLTLGIYFKVRSGPGMPATDAAFAPNAWLRIDDDGTITFVVAKSEMGQGISTALPQLIAEELEVPLESISFAFAPAHPAYRDGVGMQVTGGSTSVLTAWDPLREAGATARWMLREAAARRWGVAAEQVRMLNGAATHPDGSVLTYGELASDAASVPVPENVELKDPSEFRVIGKSAPRLDVPVKTTGEAIFGVDAGPSDARVAVVARSPVFGGAEGSYDPSAARAVPGVHEVVDIATLFT